MLLKDFHCAGCRKKNVEVAPDIPDCYKPVTIVVYLSTLTTLSLPLKSHCFYQILDRGFPTNHSISSGVGLFFTSSEFFPFVVPNRVLVQLHFWYPVVTLRSRQGTVHRLPCS